MKMKMFQFSINLENDRYAFQVVALNAPMTVDFVREHLQELGDKLDEMAILRIDNLTSEERSMGLDLLLETAPLCFASFVPGVGWIAHVAAVNHLNFYTLETEAGVLTHIIAPNPQVATAVWAERLIPGDGEPVLYQIKQGTSDLNQDQRAGLEPLLGFGPIGMVRWTDDEWSIVD